MTIYLSQDPRNNGTMESERMLTNKLYMHARQGKSPIRNWGIKAIFLIISETATRQLGFLNSLDRFYDRAPYWGPINLAKTL